MTASDGFEEAKNFFSSYFHEDWPEEARDPAEVIALFLGQGWSSEYLRRLASEIQQFAASHENDAELEQALFAELGSYYLPSADNISARTWLQGVASTLEKAAESTRLWARPNSDGDRMFRRQNYSRRFREFHRAQLGVMQQSTAQSFFFLALIFRCSHGGIDVIDDQETALS